MKRSKTSTSMDDLRSGSKLSSIAGRNPSRPSSEGVPKNGLSKTLGSRGSSRPMSRAEAPLNKKFALEFAYDLDSIILPECLCFFDFLSMKPADKMDLRGWMVNKSLFRVAGENGRNNLGTLLLDDSIGFTVQMFELIRGFQKLKVLSLASTGMDITFQAAQILGSFPRLMELNISYCRVDITSFSILCNTCQNLRQLICQSCPGLDDYCLQALAACMQRFRRLQSIDLSRGLEYSDEGFLTVLGATPKLLTRLNMSNSTNLTSLAITALRSKMPGLLHLDMSEMKLVQTCFEWITEGCTQLQVLILSKCDNLDDDALVRIGTKCLHLQKIVVNKCDKLSDFGVSNFFAGE